MKLIYISLLCVVISCTKQSKPEPVVPEIIEPMVIEEALPEYNDSVYVEDKIKRFDTFAKILQGHLAYDQIIDVYKESKNTPFSLHRIRKGQPYKITYRDSQFYKFEYEIDSKGYYEILRTDSNEFKSGIVFYEFDKDTLYAEGVIKEHLYGTMQENDFPMLLAFELANVFAWDIDFTHELRKDDYFQVYYETLHRNGEFVGVGKVLAAKFYNNKTDFSAFYYQYPDTNHYDYFSFDKRNIRKAFLKAPVEYSRVSGSFGGRVHPIQKRYKAHNGTDYVAPKNTPVMAVADGKIVQRGNNRYNGNFVKVNFSGGFSAFYLHLNAFNSKFKKGAEIKQGDVVGYVGNTGLATGHHLCFQFRKNNRPFNFQRIKNPEVKSLDSIYHNDFELKRGTFPFQPLSNLSELTSQR